MRRIAYLAMLSLMSFLLVVSGCKKTSNPTGDGGNTNTTTLVGDVSGTLNFHFTATNVVGFSSVELGGTAITGEFTYDGTEFALNLAVHAAPPTNTTYTFQEEVELGKASATLADMTSGEDSYWAISGTITFTQSGTRLVGTFQFTARNILTDEQIQVTNGQFNVAHVSE